MKKIISLALTIWIASHFVYAQNVNIPDANFKAYLVGDLTINTNGDSEIQVTEANSCTEAIDANNMGISDLTGFEAFTSVTTVDCSNNALTSLNVSANTSLESLTCHGNQLLSLDISANSSLETLICSHNQISALDLTANSNLRSLSCGWNNLTALNISQSPILVSLFCTNNTITSLDVSSNDSIGIVDCQYNQITSLDFSANQNLNILKCSSNNLNQLNIANGNNGPTLNFQATENPNLTCVQVDDVQLYNANFTNSIDPSASYSLDCVTGVHENTANDLDIFPNPVQNTLNIGGNSIVPESFEIINLSGITVLKISESTTKINVSKLPQGVYFLRYTIGNDIKHQRFIKE